MADLKKNEFAVASLVLGIISFVSLFGMEKPIAAIVFGVLALKNIQAAPQESRGKNLAIAGIVLGAAALTLAIIILINYFPQFLQTQQEMMRQREP